MLSYAIIGRNIKTARKQTKLTQAAAAHALGMSAVYYGKLERGEVKQNLGQLSDISTLFSIPIEILFLGAQPRREYVRRLLPDDTNAHMARIMRVCNSERRALIIAVCEAIAQLD